MTAPYKIFYLFGNNKVTLQAGFGVSAKNFKRAVDRNRIKRVTREAYRLQKPGLAKNLNEQGQKLSVFFIYIGKELPVYEFVYKKMGLILQKLIQISNESNTAHT